MSSQINDYYSAHRDRLLEDFDRTCTLVKGWVVARYGEVFAVTLHQAARLEFEQLIPEIPYMSGVRARVLNYFLLITAQELAVYKAMAKQGKSPAEAWALCHRALRLRVAEIPLWKRLLLRRLMFSGVLKKLMQRRARQQEKARFGDFEVEYMFGNGDDFDWGVNYLQCGNRSFAIQHGGEAFAPYICMSDIALSDAMGWGLIRTQTLADGCRYCDFRFKQGAATQISCKTPEVQAAIERIRSQETELGAVAARAS